MFLYSISKPIVYLKKKRYMSLPLANSSNAKRNAIPAICAYSRNFSLGCRRVIISTSRNSTCPPSSAGMGSMFIKARITERNAVIDQNCSQFHDSGKMLPMAPNPPRFFAPSRVNTYFIWLT